ncbi:hypothetical protein CN918_26275 [Priestia megaterium]|nr:hypothetical protein CN918_26275 [Priestia megaterium]
MTHMNKITDEEIVVMVLSSQNGCQKSKSKLAIYYKSYITSIANRLMANKEIEDVIQVGMIGLFKAISSFDLEKGEKFSSYLGVVVSGEIMRYYRDFKQLKISRPIHDASVAINKYKNSYLENNGKLPTVNQIMKHLNLSSKEVALAEGANKTCLSLHEPYSLNENLNNVYQIPLEERVSSGENPYDKKEWVCVLRAAIKDVLSPFEQDVIKYRFFIGLTQVQAAEKLNVSQTYISSTEKRIFKKLHNEILKDVI